MIDILAHALVPKHEILTSAEKKELLKRYNAGKNNLPVISVDDPVVKIIGAKPGDVLRIIRDSRTAGKSLYYRIVME